LEPRDTFVKCYLGLGYILTNQYDKAELIYKEHKMKMNRTNYEVFRDSLLQTIEELERADIKHPDFEKVIKLMNE
jgi:hypothetical protein